MTKGTASLDDLRRRIDEIDDQMHDLIMERTAVVEAVAGLKRQGRIASVRPGREALILRRLVERHRGRFPRPVLVRLWRELISGMLAVQGEVAVAVWAPAATPDCWDIARDQYGSHTPMTGFHSAGEVLRALAEGRATVGVLPMPAEGEREPWWPLLARAGSAAPRVMARLPFAGRGNARGDAGFDALMVAYGEVDPTGADRSLIALETQGEPSRARLIDALKGAGLAVTLFAAHEPDGESAWSLVELDDGVTLGDARLGQALALLGEHITRVVLLGGYAKPFAAAALAGRGDREEAS
jgi:chorismate mutase / prephenate dehydratase